MCCQGLAFQTTALNNTLCTEIFTQLFYSLSIALFFEINKAFGLLIHVSMGHAYFQNEETHSLGIYKAY